MCSKDESRLEEIPTGGKCYSLDPEKTECKCEYECECKINLIKRLCPYYVYIDDGLTKCTLLNITSDDDESFSEQTKVCGFNETVNEV